LQLCWRSILLFYSIIDLLALSPLHFLRRGCWRSGCTFITAPPGPCLQQCWRSILLFYSTLDTLAVAVLPFLRLG
jgi:hypothetical protein